MTVSPANEAWPDPVAHLPLVRMLARRLCPCAREKEELYQQGCLGLMKAVRRFDPGRGVKFSTFAVPWILGEMRQLLRQDAPFHVPRRDQDLLFKLRRAQELLARALRREPTVPELAQALRLPPSELMLLAEAPRTVSLDAPPAEDGRPLAETVSDPGSEAWMDRLLLRDLLDRLPLSDRRLLYLRLRRGLSQQETAQALCMSQAQVSRAESRIRMDLRRAWLDEPP